MTEITKQIIKWESISSHKRSATRRWLKAKLTSEDESCNTFLPHVLLEFDPNNQWKNTTKIKNRKCKTKKTTQDLRGGENEYYCSWVLITNYHSLYDENSPLELYKMREEDKTLKNLSLKH